MWRDLYYFPHEILQEIIQIKVRKFCKISKEKFNLKFL